MKASRATDHPYDIEGLSPFIGIILMALITIVLAALLGTFVVT